MSENVVTRADNTSLRRVTDEKKEKFFPKFPLKAATRSICYWCEARFVPPEITRALTPAGDHRPSTLTLSFPRSPLH